MSDLIVSVPDHCLSFYFSVGLRDQKRDRDGSRFTELSSVLFHF